MRAENNKHSKTMSRMPEEAWPTTRPPNIIEVWRSDSFLAQVYQESPEHLRVSICRTMINKSGGWKENITWEELMQIKREIGHGNSYAVEVLPMDRDIVNVANMRHFFILPAMVVGWRKDVTPVKNVVPTEPQLSDEEIERILYGDPEWEKYTGKREKRHHDIMLHDGRVIEECYPNSNYWHSKEGRFTDEQVAKIRPACSAYLTTEGP